MTNTYNKNNIFVDTNVLIGAFAPGKRFQAEKKCWKYVCSLPGKRIYVSSLSVAQLVSLFQKRKAEKDDIVAYVRGILAKANVVEFSEHDIETTRKAAPSPTTSRPSPASCPPSCWPAWTQARKTPPG